MKKLLSVILFFAFFFGQIFAQKNEFKKELYIGFGGGAMTSSVDFVPTILQKSKIGLHGGISAKYITEKSLGLLIELNYAQRGWTEEFDPETGYEFSKSLQYLEMPFMTHVYFGRKLRFVINAGPQLGFLIGSNNDMNDALREYVTEQKELLPDSQIGYQYDALLRKFDYGLVGGVGVEIKSGIGNFQAEGRYYFGLGDIFENRKSKNNYFNRSAHRIIEAKLTYYFKLK